MYGDPDALDRLAGQLRERAGEVRRHADDHVRAGHAARWVSTAAQAYQDRIGQDRRDADRVAAELGRAADALHAHARRVRETLALIARYEREASAWFEAAGRLARKVVPEAPWGTWPIGPHNLPASGDVRWLEVGRFMRGQGVL
jgi:hypothetical protein